MHVRTRDASLRLPSLLSVVLLDRQPLLFRLLVELVVVLNGLVNIGIRAWCDVDGRSLVD